MDKKVSQSYASVVGREGTPELDKAAPVSAVPKRPTSEVASIRPRQHIHPAEPRKPPQMVSPRIPYELCLNLKLENSCRYGEKCHFAHSEDELKEWNQSRVRIPRKIPGEYKLCWNMQNERYCPWGERCGFAHSDVELEKWNQHFRAERKEYLRSLSEDGEQQSEPALNRQVCPLLFRALSIFIWSFTLKSPPQLCNY